MLQVTRTPSEPQLPVHASTAATLWGKCILALKIRKNEEYPGQTLPFPCPGLSGYNSFSLLKGHGGDVSEDSSKFSG